MTFSQFIDVSLPLLMGFGGLYLVVHAKVKAKQRNRELEASWRTQRMTDEEKLEQAKQSEDVGFV